MKTSATRYIQLKHKSRGPRAGNIKMRVALPSSALHFFEVPFLDAAATSTTQTKSNLLSILEQRTW
jgi:hypothetical protein